MHADAIVVGAGIQGCSIALHLALSGAQVTVVEKNGPGAHASGVNAGSIHHIARLVRELPLAEMALRTWHQIADLVDDDCGFRRVGHLKLAESEEDMEVLAAMGRDVEAACGIRESLIGQSELRRMEPHVSPHCVGGIFSPDCGYALPARAINALRRKAERLGVRFIVGEEVIAIRRAGRVWNVETARRAMEARLLFNCAGAWGGRIAAAVGDPVRLTPLALQMIVLSRMPPVMNTVIALTRRILSIKQFENGTVVIGGGYRGTPDLETGSSHLDLGRMGHNMRTAAEAYPSLRRGQVVRCWAGLEGRSEDGLPIIGPGGAEEGVWHAFGFSAHGFYLGPAVGSALVDLALGKEPKVSLAPFNIRRFSEASRLH